MNDRFKYRIPFFDNSGKFIGFEDLDILKGVQPYNAGACNRGEPEQCTGLKDKNGKLIYEGDIVRELFDDGSFMDKVVFYNKLQCRWFIEYKLPCAPGDSAYWGLNSSKAKALEIIGNVNEMEVAKLMEEAKEQK